VVEVRWVNGGSPLKRKKRQHMFTLGCTFLILWLCWWCHRKCWGWTIKQWEASESNHRHHTTTTVEENPCPVQSFSIQHTVRIFYTYKTCPPPFGQSLPGQSPSPKWPSIMSVTYPVDPGFCRVLGFSAWETSEARFYRYLTGTEISSKFLQKFGSQFPHKR